MRIAHVITRMIVGGAQENTLLCCQDLARQYEDDVLLITGPAIGPEGDLLQQGRGGDIHLVQLDRLRRSIHPWRDTQSYFALKCELRRFNPHVVHTHSAKGGILGRIAAHALRVPAIVHTVHGAPFHPYQSAPARVAFRWCEWLAASRCHQLVSVADAMTELLVDAGVAPRDKFTTIYSGMDVEPFLNAHQHRARLRAELGFTDDHIVIGKVARLFPLKGHNYVVAAARRMISQNPHVRFLMVGDGLLRERLRATIQKAGLADHFHFTGLVAPRRIAELMGAMDILVHASLREGLARALPQALIAGKPVVSFDIDGAREVVIPDQTGFLAAPKDVDGLARALLRLVADQELRNRLGQHGRDRFTEQFRHSTMTHRLRELYVQLLERADD